MLWKENNVSGRIKLLTKKKLYNKAFFIKIKVSVVRLPEFRMALFTKKGRQSVLRKYP